MKRNYGFPPFVKNPKGVRLKEKEPVPYKKRKRRVAAAH